MAKKAAAKKYPTAKVGNYAAPVDTAGMDPEMKRTMSIGMKRQSPLSNLFKKKKKP